MGYIYNINSVQPFAKTLAKGILDRFLTEDPFSLVDMTILLPNKRSCSSLKKAFLEVSGNKNLILPKLYDLGEIDEDETIFKMGQIYENKLPKVISQLKQKLILTKLVEKWKSNENISLSHSSLLANELSLFLNEVTKEKLSLDDLDNIVPDDFAKHWQITLDFLKILVDKWPLILEDYGGISYIEYRNQVLKLNSQFWQSHGSKSPVLIAGTTASIPATLDLSLIHI